jgi:hypothetical protein
MAGVSAKGISRRDLASWDFPSEDERVPDIGISGIEGERVCDEWPLVYPLVPLIRGRAMPLEEDGRSNGISGSVRSLRSVMWFSSFSAFTLSRFTQARSGWFW